MNIAQLIFSLTIFNKFEISLTYDGIANSQSMLTTTLLPPHLI